MPDSDGLYGIVLPNGLDLSQLKPSYTLEMIDDFSITGTAEVCLEKIKVLEDLGVGEISSGYYNGCIDQVEKVGREIVPHV